MTLIDPNIMLKSSHRRTVCIIFVPPTQTLDRNLKVGYLSWLSFKGIQSIIVGGQNSFISQGNDSMFTGQPMGNKKQAGTGSGYDLQRPTPNDLLPSFKGSTAFKIARPQTGEQGHRISAWRGAFQTYTVTTT